MSIATATLSQAERPAVRVYAKEVCPRKTQLGVAHDLAHKLGYETRPGKPGRERYEDELQKLIGVRTLRWASREQRDFVVGWFTTALEAQERVRPVDLPPVSDDEALEVLGLL